MSDRERFNLAEWLLDRNVREGRGDRPAVRSGDQVYSYAEIAELQNRCGNALRELGTGSKAAF
jgi:acyl-coenzyme A synthetase/AMP-(fatty) acid ligase